VIHRWSRLLFVNVGSLIAILVRHHFPPKYCS
jgi:hypothetical protein